MEAVITGFGLGAGHPFIPQAWAPVFANLEGDVALVARADTSTVPLECMVEGVPDDPHPPLLLGGRARTTNTHNFAERRGQHSPCHVYLDQLFATDTASDYLGEMTTLDGRPIRTRRKEVDR